MIKENQYYSHVETVEKHIRLIAVVAILGGLMNFASAIQKVGISFDGAIWIVEMTLAMSMLLAVIPIFILRIAKLDRRERRAFIHLEGFVFDVLKRALVISWAATFVLAVGMQITTKHYFAETPTRFFLEILLSTMLLAYGISYFLIDRVGDVEGDDPQ